MICVDFDSPEERHFMVTNAEGIRMMISECSTSLDSMDLEASRDAYDAVWCAEELVKKLSEAINTHYEFQATL